MNHWYEMIDEISGGVQEKIKAFNQLMHNEPLARRDHGISDELFGFMSKADLKH